MHLLLISSQIFFSFLFFAKQNATPVHNYNLYTQKYKSNKQVLHFTLQLRFASHVPHYLPICFENIYSISTNSNNSSILQFNTLVSLTRYTPLDVVCQVLKNKNKQKLKYIEKQGFDSTFFILIRNP